MSLRFAALLLYVLGAIGVFVYLREWRIGARLLLTIGWPLFAVLLLLGYPKR